MRTAITGSSGLIGGALREALEREGHEVIRFRRDRSAPSEAFWDPSAGVLPGTTLGKADAVVHLAGENIASGRWTAAKRRRIRESRVQPTRLLSEALAGLKDPPKTLLCASAAGYYGDRGEEILHEESPPGAGFLPEVCREWEAAADAARERGIRVVHLRFGMVLSAKGGGLAAMLPIFRLGLGGPLGSGRQWVSWVSLEDSVRAIQFVLQDPSLSGPINIASPSAARQKQFAKSIGCALRRPAFLPTPGWALRWVLGPMATELLLASARARPRKLLDHGFRFNHSDLETAFRHLLGPA